MNKPITVVFEDFKTNLTDLINNAGLPPFIIGSILQNYLSEINALSTKQFEKDLLDYNRYLNNVKEE